MIQLVRTEDGPKIVFRPWSNVNLKELESELKVVYNKIQLPELEFPLIYGHVCPRCENVIQAAFITDKPVDPRGYEEFFTTLRDKQGNIKVVRTGVHPRFKSKYETTLVQRGNKISAQMIRLGEHFDKNPEIEGLLCHYTSYFSFRPDMALQQVLLNNGMNPSAYSFTAEDVEEIAVSLASSQYVKDEYLRVKDVAGSAPDAWIVKRGAYSWMLSPTLRPYL